MSDVLLAVSNLGKTFRRDGRDIVALEGVDLQVKAGETLGVIGPSGSGKSTLARLVLRLVEPDTGSIAFAGRDLIAAPGAELRAFRRRLQMVFQDPLAAFNPRATVERIIDDPLRVHGIGDRNQRQRAVGLLLERVGLSDGLRTRHPHEISGGQRQRVAIARALATSPDLIVLDEALASLDVGIQLAILELLLELQRERNVSYLFISHDLAAVGGMAHRIAVLDRGRVVEAGPTGDVLSNPRSVMGKALVAARLRLPPAGGAGEPAA